MATRRTWTTALCIALGAATLQGACGSGNGNGGFGTGDDAGGGDDSTTGDDRSLGDDVGHFGGDSPSGVAIDVQPHNPVLTQNVPGPSVTQQFQAIQSGMMISANWSIDAPDLGVIDATGLFKASGAAGGMANVFALAGGNKGQTTVTVKLVMSGNTGNIDPNTQKQLQTGGNADATFRWLYPYDATVFPRGLIPPVLQFDGTAPTAMYVHVSGMYFDYKDYFAGSTPAQISIAQANWDTIAKSAAPGEKIQVQVTKVSGGQVSGPITEHWVIAQGSLKGTVYYNTYDSPQAMNTGAVMRIKPGAAMPDVLIGQCNTCHAVSADGSTLVASHGSYTAGASYDLKNNAAVLYDAPDSRYGFGGVYPDGTMMLSCASMVGGWSNGDQGPNIPGLGNIGNPSGDRPSKLYDTKSGAVIAAPGFDGVVTHALMPMFSPDGKHVAFNDYDSGMGHSLFVMDFAKATHTFSGKKQVANDATLWLGWPAFTPDSANVVFEKINDGDYATWNFYGSEPDHKSDLYTVPEGGGAAVALDGLNGIANGTTYLPYGDPEAHMNFEPTILPVAAGGYFWVVFTSRREYGNTITDANPYEYQPAKRKKLWVAAIDIAPKAGVDPSHPAFYLPGQELGAGNMRGFWVLDPCKQNGIDCSSGDECCEGFCRQVNQPDGAVSYQCVPPPNGCSQEYESCKTSADCCANNPPMLCIDGHCAIPTPQ
jgi:hypothetical protein